MLALLGFTLYRIDLRHALHDGWRCTVLLVFPEHVQLAIRDDLAPESFLLGPVQHGAVAASLPSLLGRGVKNHWHARCDYV